jgi:hypothetical protein
MILVYDDFKKTQLTSGDQQKLNCAVYHLNNDEQNLGMHSSIFGVGAQF